MGLQASNALTKNEAKSSHKGKDREKQGQNRNTRCTDCTRQGQQCLCSALMLRYGILLIITWSRLTSKIWATRDAVVVQFESTSTTRGPITCTEIKEDSAGASWYILDLLQCFGDMKCNTITEDTEPCKHKTNGYSKIISNGLAPAHMAVSCYCS